jgi:enoyl-CoA hydratase/carnithine racemase
MANVILDVSDKVAVVTLAKPPHNLLDDQLIEQLCAAYRKAVAGGSRAILLRSSMRHFCAGAEVQSFGTTTVVHTDRTKFQEFFDVLENTPVPTVAALNGGVLGGGLEMALTCDMIVAANTAFMGQVEVAVGLLPLLGGIQRLVQRVGPARAKEIVMLGRRHTPEAFERWGVINLVVPERELPSASLNLAKQLAAGPTAILKGMKTLANTAAQRGTDAADELQVGINEMIWRTKDRQRGFDAFFSTGPGTAVFEGD